MRLHHLEEAVVTAWSRPVVMKYSGCGIRRFADRGLRSGASDKAELSDARTIQRVDERVLPPEKIALVPNARVMPLTVAERPAAAMDAEVAKPSFVFADLVRR
jgi:hypothetical protein